MYSEFWINKYGENNIYNQLKNGKSIHITSHDEEDISFSLAAEHYLVKNRKSTDLIINDRIDSLFEAFSKHPLAFSYSYILSNEKIVLDLIENNEKRKQLFLEGKRELERNWSATYNDLMNDELVDDYDKARFINLLILGIRFGDSKHQDIIDNYVFKLLRENRIPDNDYEKLLLFNYASKKTLGVKYKNKNNLIKLGNLKPYKPNTFRGGFENGSMIVMNDHPSKSKFYGSLPKMIQCVCHEATHVIQEHQAKEESTSVHAMEMAIQELFGFDEYQTGDNYLFNEIEEDAQLNGYNTAGLIYGLVGRKDIQNKLFDDRLDYIKKTKFYYEYVTVIEDGKEVRMSKEKYNVENIRRIVKENPYLINRYPVLNNLFDLNGNHKPLEKMLSEPFKSQDIKKMYTDFIIYDIKHDELNNIDLTFKNENYKYNVLKNLCWIFTDLTDKATDIIIDSDYRTLNNDSIRKTSFIYEKTIIDIIKLGKFIEKELPFMREFEKNNPGNYYTYTSYTNDLRSLFRIIDKYKAENRLTNLESVNVYYSNELNDLESNMKNEYLEYILEHFSFNERNSLLKFDNDYMSLEKFVRTDFLNHLHRDHYLLTNDKRIIRNEKGASFDPLEFVRYIYKTHKFHELDDMLTDNNDYTIVESNKVK